MCSILAVQVIPMITATKGREPEVKPQLMQTGLRLPPDVWKRIKVAARERDTSTSAIVVSAVEKYLGGKRRGQSAA